MSVADVSRTLTAVGVPRYRLRVLDNDLSFETLRVRVGALNIHCVVWGRGNDPIAVLLHGNGGHAHWWDSLLPALVPGHQVIAPDLRGHGKSEWPEPPCYRLDDFAADLMGLLVHLAPEPVVLVGHSMGGRVAAWCAAHYPERFRRLALLDTRMGGVVAKIAQKWRGRIAGTRQGRGYATREEALAAFRLVPDETNVDADILAQLARHAVCERGPGDWTFCFDRAVLSLGGDGAGELYGMLDRIRCPTLLMHGQASWVMDTNEVAAMRAAIPDCRSLVFPGGHHFFLAQPQRVGAALRGFIDGTEDQMAEGRNA
jgi:pimeloyl-ACP methyl ester carboxylesterase